MEDIVCQDGDNYTHIEKLMKSLTVFMLTDPCPNLRTHKHIKSIILKNYNSI